MPPWMGLLPWLFVVAGLAPFAVYEVRPAPLGAGFVHLLSTLLLAGCASLYARAPLPQPARLAWSAGLGSLAGGMALRSANALLELGPAATRLGAIEGLAYALAALGFLLAFRALNTLEHRPIQPLSEPRYRHARTHTMNRRALDALSDSLERLARRQPVMLMLFELNPERHARVRELVRGPDLVFYLGEDRFLFVLQNAVPEAALRVRERLERELGVSRVCVLPFRGGDLRHALTQLQAELGV